MRRSRCLFACFLFLLGSAVMSSGYTAMRYAEDVIAGRQVVCKYTRFAVERHLRDLDRAASHDPSFPYRFDEHQAARIIDFKQQLRHTQGPWANPRLHDTRIRLGPWQQFKDWVLFGWRHVETQYRRFTKCYETVGRKNGKTTDAAATANACYFADRPREMGPQVYCVATKRDQAKIAWEEAKRQIERHPVLRERARIYKQNSVITLRADSAAKFTIWGKDADTQDGFNPSVAVVDEMHALPDNSMIEVIESGLGSRPQPLELIITTAGFDKSSACYQEEHTLAERVLERSIDPVPENYLCFIYTLDEGDDFQDPDVWIKPNPNLGVSVSREYLHDRVQTALQMPSRMNGVLTKNFNIWTQAETRWILDELWKTCAFPVDEAALAGRPCYVGIDLSATRDITAVVYCFPPRQPGGKYELVFRFFIPGDNVLERERQDRVPYGQWIKMGLVTATPGYSVDYDFIEQQIYRDARAFKIQEIAYDPWKAHDVVRHLEAAGFQMVEIRQGPYGMARPTDTFEQKVLAHEIAHGGNPVMSWMVSCTEVVADSRGNLTPIKPGRHQRGKRIDGVVASMMALDRAVLHFNAFPARYVNDPTPLSARPAAAGIRKVVF